MAKRSDLALIEMRSLSRGFISGLWSSGRQTEAWRYELSSQTIIAFSFVLFMQASYLLSASHCETRRRGREDKDIWRLFPSAARLLMKVVWIWNLAKQSPHLSGALTALLGGPNQRSTGQRETPSAYRLCRPKYSHSDSPLVYVLLRVTTPPPFLLLFTAKFTAEAPKITDSLFGNTEKSERLIKMPLLKSVRASGQCPIVPVSLKRWRSHWRGSAFRPILHILYTDGQCCVGVLPASIPKETHIGPGRKHTFYRLGEITRLWHWEVIVGEEFLTVFKDMLNFLLRWWECQDETLPGRAVWPAFLLYSAVFKHIQ